MEKFIEKAGILIEAIPYIQAFRSKIIVAKYGGSAIDNPAAMKGVLQDLIFLSTVGIRSVLVHGGGPEITRKLSERGRKTEFINGVRVTDRETVRVVNQALSEINRRLVTQVRSLGGHAEGIVAKQRVIIAEPHTEAATLGYVGSVSLVRIGPIRMILKRHAIPVISPVGIDGAGQLYNINADDVASDVAAHLKAEKLVLLTNVRGILRHGSLISTLSVKQVQQWIDRQVIQAGMIPKVNACVHALRHGVKKTHIIDAGISHAMLLEIFTKRGIGTEIIRSS